MPGHKTCIIPECSSKSSSIRLFRLPSRNRKDVLEAWHKILRYKCPEVLRLTTGDKRICKLHFEAKCFKPDGRRIMSAIPTLFTAHEISSGAPAEDLKLARQKKISQKTTLNSGDNHLDGGGGVYSKENESTEINLEEKKTHKTPLQEHKFYCVTHDHDGYKMRKPIGADAPLSPNPSGVAENDECTVPFEADYPALDDDQDVEDDTPAPIQFQEVDSDKVMSLPEGICVIPLPPEAKIDETEDLSLPDILDPDLLNPDLLKDSSVKDKPPAYGENLDAKLCHLWPPLLVSGLSEKARHSIVTGYPTPNNCRLIQTPQMNAKIVEMVPEKIIANDGKWNIMQQYISTALTAINRGMEMLLAGNNRVMALRHLSNSCLILCDLHYIHTRVRVNNVMPFLDDTTKRVIKDTQRDDTVFGNTFFKKWRIAKKLERKGRRRPKRVQKKRGTCSGQSLVLYSGRWHPPRPAIKGSARMGGARRLKGAPRRRKAIQGKPRPVGSPAPNTPGGGVKRKNVSDRTKLSPIKEVEQYDAFGEKISPDIETSFPHMHVEVDDIDVQEETVVDQCNESSITYNPLNTVRKNNNGDCSKLSTMKRGTKKIKQIEQYDAFGDKMTSKPHDNETTYPHMHIEADDGYIQEEVVYQYNQSSFTYNPHNTVKRKNPGDGSKLSLVNRTTKKIKQVEQYDAFGDKITSKPPDIETSYPHMHIEADDGYVHEEVIDQCKQSSFTYNPHDNVRTKDRGHGSQLYLKKRSSTKKSKQIVLYDTFGERITSIPPDI